MMAAKAKLMADVIDKALNEDKANNAKSELYGQYEAFKTVLIHDISHAEFADVYAQTIAYGMFAARYHDPTLPTFTRHEAATLIPQSNPFLRQLFRTIAGYNLDDTDGKRLLWIVEELVQIFLATDVASIMRNFGKATRQQDPVVHFYETFLAAYDPKLRKARGVWYTPEPVVNFIVRAVDDILKTKFNLPKGFADTSKTQITVDVQGAGKKGETLKVKKEIHKVQILDPATGTGTFLAQTVRHIYNTQFASMQGMWPQYVHEHLIQRLNGFELLMTSYAMAHLKLDMLLTETGAYATTPSELRSSTPSEEREFKAVIPLQNEGVARSDGVVKTANKLSELPYNPALKAKARELRKAGNLSEVLFWNAIKNKQFDGLDFDRQRVIGNYIVDFYCHEHALVVEIDGSSHDDKREYDANRDAFLTGLGLNVLHIQDSEVKKNLAGVLELVKKNITTPPSAPLHIEGELSSFAPIDLLDYIYAVLHSPTYRETYKEFLKIDFPRLPYPKDVQQFWQLVSLGSQLRQTHLLEACPASRIDIGSQNMPISYLISGNNTLSKLKFDAGKVYINETQYFENVSEIAWNFYIGGYQPAQKWLKDRKGRALNMDDIEHYQKIIAALMSTHYLMQEID